MKGNSQFYHAAISRSFSLGKPYRAPIGERSGVPGPGGANNAITTTVSKIKTSTGSSMTFLVSEVNR